MSIKVAHYAADISITVTSTADMPDGNPGDGRCDNASLFGTGCSLRA
jgi:CSLREA domain-containing protein